MQRSSRVERELSIIREKYREGLEGQLTIDDAIETQVAQDKAGCTRCNTQAEKPYRLCATCAKQLNDKYYDEMINGAEKRGFYYFYTDEQR